MKKFIITISIFIFSVTAINSQEVSYLNWSDHATFLLSKSPIITGKGIHSDSLSQVYDGKVFYEHNDVYYIIDNWADYYRWFVKEYYWKFEQSDLYEYYYLVKNDYGMASFICNKYLGKYYPSYFTITFTDKDITNKNAFDKKKIVHDTKSLSSLKKSIKMENATKSELKILNSPRSIISIDIPDSSDKESIGSNSSGVSNTRAQNNNSKNRDYSSDKSYSGSSSSEGRLSKKASTNVSKNTSKENNSKR